MSSEERQLKIKLEAFGRLMGKPDYIVAKEYESDGDYAIFHAIWKEARENLVKNAIDYCDCLKSQDYMDEKIKVGAGSLLASLASTIELDKTS